MMLDPTQLSTAVTHALRAGKWTPERCIDISDFVAMLKPYGWQISRPAQDILESLGDLDFEHQNTFAVANDVLLPLETKLAFPKLSFELAFFTTYDDDILYRIVHEHPYIQALGLKELYPVGYFYYQELIFVAPNGAIYIMGYHSSQVPRFPNTNYISAHGMSIYEALDEFVTIVY